MSNEIGKIFRRMTLATLGLDDLEGVSEQSFDVVERADAFVGRLLGGLSHVIPAEPRMESRAAELSEHVYAGLAGLNGPRSATDLGEWQYWLDAALLMLFDDDEEDSESVNSESVRARVSALRSRGVKPQVLQSVAAGEKKSLARQIQAQQSVLKVKNLDIGKEFEGEYYVKAATHSYRVGGPNNGYWTKFEVAKSGR